jgi:hypothetical protein
LNAQVLVLHVKRFTATANGSYCKLHKPVAFPASLRLDNKVICSRSSADA